MQNLSKTFDNTPGIIEEELYDIERKIEEIRKIVNKLTDLTPKEEDDNSDRD